jgi:hypothetical protein
MRINDPEIVADLQALYPKYEAALWPTMRRR